MSIYIKPTDNNYPGLDRGFNQRFKLEDGLSSENGEGIYLVSDANDIVSTLNNVSETYSPRSGEIKVVSGGHCYENFTFQRFDETDTDVHTRFVIDLSNMQEIYEENIGGKDYIVVEPGASNWKMQQTLHSVYGAALPGGSCYSVCAGGHISGGGYGLLSRLHGLTVDYLAGVEMVVPSPDNTGFAVRQFTPDGDDDQLDWASRGGGGGHFGIITKYYFEKGQVPPAPEHALFIALPVPWLQFTGADGADNFSRFLSAYYEACALLPGQAFTLGKFSYKTSDDDMMSIAVQVVYGENSGHDSTSLRGTNILPIRTKAAAMEVIALFWSALDQWIAEPETSIYHKKTHTLKGHPVSTSIYLDTVYDLPWIDMAQLLNGSGENQNGKYKSSYMIENFNDTEAAAIHAFLTDSQNGNPVPGVADKAQTLIQIDSYGLQINDIDDGIARPTAIAARSSLLKVQYQTYWKDFAETTQAEAKMNEEEIITWFNAGYNHIYSQAQGNIENNGFPLWGTKYQGCYFNYPDRQLGVNSGYKGDPGEVYSGNFLEIYFGFDVEARLMEIKKQIDPNNIFAYSQSVLNTVS